jgi:hypothetical protein
MRRGALVDLLIRPVTIIQVSVFAPLAVIMLFLAAGLRPGAAIAASSMACAGFGLFVGQGIRVAARCVFAWTLPAFRRALLRELVAVGLAVSGLATAVTLIGGAGTQQALAVFAVGFASFALGAVSLLAAEVTQLLVFAYIVIVSQFASWRPAAPAIQGAPLATVAIAGAVSALVLWGTFSRGAFRWSALTGPRQSGHSIWHELSLTAWRPRRRARSTSGEVGVASPARYVGDTVAGSVLANYRAVQPVAWLFLPFVFLLCLAVFQSDVFGGVHVNPFTASWFVLAFVWWTSASWSRRSACQAMLPWSRRHHVTVAYVRDLGDGLLFLLLMLAAAALVGGLEGIRGPVLCGLAGMAAFFPAARWMSGPPVGERWKSSAVGAVLALVGVGVFLVVLGVVTHLPDVVSSGTAQGVLLGLLVLLSQVLHWRGLRRYLTTRDLVGDSM